MTTDKIQLDLGYSGSRQSLSFYSRTPVWLTYMKDRTKIRLRSSVQGTWQVVAVSRNVDEDSYKVTVRRVD